jgi:hypothetical protein
MFANCKPRPNLVMIVGFLLFAVGRMPGAAAEVLTATDSGPLIVHEWGTFLSVQGSDGRTLGGMIDSEERLPGFVRERDLDGRPRRSIFAKMETPVTYFYVDRPRTVQVRVGMPRGLLTHWYPAVDAFGPPWNPNPSSVAPGSFLDWGKVELLPERPPNFVGPPQPSPELPRVASTDPWRFARETDAAHVIKYRPLLTIATRKGEVITGIPVKETKTHLIIRDVSGRDFLIPHTAIEDKAYLKRFPADAEREKFLFYRGLGSFDLPLHVKTTGTGDQVQLTLHNGGKDLLRGLFAVRVAKDTIQYAQLADLPAGTIQQGSLTALLSSRQPLNEGVPHAKEVVAATLVREGLYIKEAQAMVNTWEKSYYRTEGLRLLYVLPRALVDDTIPLQIRPAPLKLERVMIGRIEVLTPDLEQRIEQAVADLTVPHPAVRLAAAAALERLGRIQEPVLRRIAALTTRPEVRAQAQALLANTAADAR